MEIILVKSHGTHLVAFVSLIGRSSRRVRESVRLGVLVRPELFLSCLQHHGSLHHVFLIFVLIKASPQQAGIEAVFVSVISNISVQYVVTEVTGIFDSSGTTNFGTKLDEKFHLSTYNNDITSTVKKKINVVS